MIPIEPEYDVLNFIIEHNGKLVTRIGLPVFNNTSNRVVLPNNTLLQIL